MKIDKKIIYLFVFSLIIQIIFLLLFLNTAGELALTTGDGAKYLSLAKNLLNRHQFILYDQPDILPQSFRTPLYPLFVAGCLAITSKLWFISVIQILITCFNVFLIYKISLLFLNKKWALVPSILFILNPFVLYSSVIIMSEVLFLLFFLLSIYYLISYLKNQDYKKIIPIFLFLAISTLIRPVSYYLLVVFLIAIIIILIKQKINYKKIAITLVLAILSWAIIITPWMYRNYKIFNSFSLASVQNYNLYFYNARLLYSKTNNRSKDKVEADFWKKTESDLTPAAANRQVSTYSYIKSLYAGSYLKDKAFSIIFNHPFTYANIHLIGSASFFFDAGWRNVADVFRLNIGQPKNLSLLLSQYKYKLIFSNITQNSIYFILFSIEKIYYFIIFILAILGIIKSPKDKRIYFLLLIGLILYFSLTSGPVASARYRYPIEPFILILSVWGLSGLEVFNKNKEVSKQS